MKNQSKRVVPEFFTTRYSKFALLGSGGMGEVYKAYDSDLAKDVAIKILPAQLLTPERVMRFQQEARAASKLNHPNLVQTLDFGIADSGEPYLILEYVSGEPLDRVLDAERKLPVNAAVNIVIQVCNGMQHAHGNGVIHRDLKPSNIVVMDKDLSTAQIKIIDFGIAKVASDSGSGPSLTQSGNFIGTPYYMSPEQISGDEVDERSDVYSVGCILFRMLTGLHVFESDILLEILQNTLQTKAPAIREVASNDNDVPLELEMTVARSLEKDPVKRQQSMQALKDEIIKVMEHERSWTSASTTYGALPAAEAPAKQSSAPSVGMHAGLITAALLLMIFGLGAVALVTLLPKEKEPAVDGPKADDPNNETAADAAASKFMIEKNGQEWFAQIGVNISDSDLKALRKTNFSRLELVDQRDITDSGLKYIENKPLYRLNLKECNIGDEGVKHLEKISTLRQLDLELTRTSDIGLSYLKTLPLKELSLGATRVTDAGLKELKGLTGLNYLDISGNAITGKGIEDIKSLKLSELSAGGCKFDNESLKSIGEMHSIKRLFIGHNNITADGLRNLANLQKLELLSLDNCKKIDDKAVSYIVKTWPKLEKLDVSETDVSPEGIKTISTLKDLEEIKIGSLDLKDADLEPLLKLKKLRLIELTYNPLLTDAGAKKLAAIKSLKTIMAHGCNKVTVHAATYIRKQIPGVRIFRNRTEEFDGQQEEVGNFVDILGR